MYQEKEGVHFSLNFLLRSRVESRDKLLPEIISQYYRHRTGTWKKLLAN